MRRVQLRGHTNILKRLLIHTAGFNLGLLMRQLIGVGTPRGLQGRLTALLGVLLTLIGATWQMAISPHPSLSLSSIRRHASIARDTLVSVGAWKTGFTTGC